MIIYIEVLVIFILISVIVLWKVWDSLSRRRLIKKYKPENDKSRKGGATNQGRLAKTERGVNLEIESSGGSDKSEGRELFSTTDVNSVGENSDSTRRNSKGLNKLLRRSKK